MRYKVGDVVKLRDDLEEGEYYGKLGFHARMCWMKNKPIKIINIDRDGDYKTECNWYINDEMIEGLWEECKGITYEPYEVKTNKLKLIDILNMIAKGELKEGAKVIYNGTKYEFREVNNRQTFDLFDKDGETFFTINYIGSIRNEVELIEPERFADVGKSIEPTDNAKIKELEWHRFNTADKIFKRIVFDKLNEVIRYINK